VAPRWRRCWKDVSMAEAMTCDNPKHKGHKRYAGGIMDGQVSHLIYADPSDYPQTLGTLKREGVRSWYEIDYEASEGTEVVYRFVGIGAEFPAVPLEPR
jgi:hypothetical protein